MLYIWLFVTCFREREKRRSESGAEKRQPGKVFIGGLASYISKDDVETAFRRFGKLDEVWLSVNPSGFGFVHYVFPRDAFAAIQAMNGRTLRGVKITVEAAKSVRPMGSGRGVPITRSMTLADARMRIRQKQLAAAKTTAVRRLATARVRRAKAVKKRTKPISSSPENELSRTLRRPSPVSQRSSSKKISLADRKSPAPKRGYSLQSSTRRRDRSPPLASKSQKSATGRRRRSPLPLLPPRRSPVSKRGRSPLPLLAVKRSPARKRNRSPLPLMSKRSLQGRQGRTPPPLIPRRGQSPPPPLMSRRISPGVRRGWSSQRIPPLMHRQLSPPRSWSPQGQLAIDRNEHARYRDDYPPLHPSDRMSYGSYDRCRSPPPPPPLMPPVRYRSRSPVPRRRYTAAGWSKLNHQMWFSFRFMKCFTGPLFCSWEHSPSTRKLCTKGGLTSVVIFIYITEWGCWSLTTYVV